MLIFSNPEKAHACTDPRRLTYIAWKSVQGHGLWAVGSTRKKDELTFLMRNFAHT